MSNQNATYASDYSCVIGTVSIILLYLINWYRRPKNMPPGPRGVPIVGYLPFMGKKLELAAYQLSKKLGNILTIRIGVDDVVFLNDYESVYKVSVTRKNLFTRGWCLICGFKGKCELTKPNQYLLQNNVLNYKKLPGC